MPPARQTADDSDLALIGRSIRRRIWVVIICVAAATLAAALVTVRAQKEYSATAALLLRASAEVEAQRAVDTNLQLLSLPAVAERAARAVPGMSREEVEEAVESKQQAESDVIRVKATTTDPQRAADLANAFAREFVAFRGGTSDESLQTGGVERVERATPNETPVSPKPVRNLVFGALIGLVIGLGLALLIEQLDRRVKREDDLAEATEMTLLASIPKRRSFDRKHLGRELLSPAEMESFRLLRANLRHFKGRQDFSSILVASAEAGEGKTLVSVGLALAAATSGERVLLLEADLRDPTLSTIMRLSRSGGLSGILTGAGGSLSETVTEVRAARLVDSAGGARLDVLPAGAIPANPTALIESRRMSDLIAEAEAEYELVVIDSPPALVVSDAIPLMSMVSGVLAVSGLGVSTRGSAAELAVQLDRLGAPVLGLVANLAEGRGQADGRYGYGRPPQLEQMESTQARSR